MTDVSVGELPETLSTARLRLPLITPEDAAGMLAGKRRQSWHRDYPTSRDQDAVAMVKAGDPAASWGPRHLVRAGDGTTIGSVGFYGAPSAGDDEVLEAEVGFGLVADARGFGAAVEALGVVLAETDRLGVRVRAGVRPENSAALKVLARCGFTQLRGAGEDGTLVMVRPLG